MKKICRLFFVLAFTICGNVSFSQNIIQDYKFVKNGSLRIGTGDKDFMTLIQSGYTLMLPENELVKGVLIFLEDSGFDQKNKSAKQLYDLASKKGFAVLSVSTEIPFDFYFSESSLHSTHKYIKDVFAKYNLPNENIFFLGASLTGHRAMRYIKFIKEEDADFKLNIDGIVICNFTLDWTRKWHQHQREMRINRNDLWEAKFINYMLETYLEGTPLTVPENYHNFSAYSYFDEDNRNIKIYKDLAVRAYIEPKIKYRLKKYLQTLYENNSTDMVGFLAELELAGNENTELIVLPSDEDTSKSKTSQATWNVIDKVELMDWIEQQTK